MERRIKVSPGFCALICILGWYDLRLCRWFLLSLLVHELGHGAVLALLGVSMTGFRLRLSGAVINCGLCTYRQELYSAAAGPAAGMLLALMAARRQPELALLSALLSGVNLLPLYPLDGGRILRAALLLRWQEPTAARILSRVRFAVSGLMMLGACWATAVAQAGIWPIFAVLVILCRVGTGEQ